MVTTKDLKHEKRKRQREEREKIEGKLHPSPVIDGIEILHRHAGKYIYFTAWKDGERINAREIRVDRESVLYSDNVISEKGIRWLSGIEEMILSDEDASDVSI